MLDSTNTTPFQSIYNNFLAKITDDLYLELTPEDTERDLSGILISAIPAFEFPRFALFNYDENYVYEDEFFGIGGPATTIGRYEVRLTREEVDILSDLMLIEWLRRQLDSVENTRLKYNGSDFKFTSQANHTDKLIKLKRDMETTNKRKQRLYKRRKIDSAGRVTPNYSQLAGGAINGSRN